MLAYILQLFATFATPNTNHTQTVLSNISLGPKFKPMKKVTTIIAALFIAAVFTMTFESCGKYEEGPGFSLKTKKGRLARAWKIDKYIDGATGTSVSPSGDDETITFNKDGNFTIASSGFSFSGTWEFSSDKEDLIVGFSFFGATDYDTTKIIRLTSKEFWTKDVDGSNDETRYVAK